MGWSFKRYEYMRLLEWKHKIFDPKRRAAYNEYKKDMEVEAEKKKEKRRFDKLAENRRLRRKMT